MMYPVENEAEVYETVVAYLERRGVTGLRQPHDPQQVNKRAVLRWLLLEKHQEALDNPPPPPDRIRRAGALRQQRIILPSASPSKRRT